MQEAKLIIVPRSIEAAGGESSSGKEEGEKSEEAVRCREEETSLTTRKGREARKSLAC